MRRREFCSLLTLGAAAPAVDAGLRSALRPRPASDEQFIERWSWAMGQSVHLRLFHSSAEQGRLAAQSALAELRRLEALLSGFEEGSELSELNRSAGRKPLRIGEDLRAILELSDRFRRASGNAFHPAVEPLMQLWGFRDATRPEPTARELAEAEAAVRAATVRLEGDRCFLPSRHTRLDLGGIAVGYGLDRMGAVLRRAGVRRALVEVSGDVLALGAPPGAAGWTIDLADSAHPGRMLGAVRIRDQALATSAGTVAVARVGSRLVGHVMDPRSGYPADGRRQVTVVARRGIEADALSTALLVSGVPAEGVQRFWIS